MEFYDGTNARMRRGNSDSIEITGLDLVNGDTVYFTVKDSPYVAEKRIQKVITEFTELGNAVIPIRPEDTKNLNVRDYVYDIEVHFANGDVLTIVPPEPSLPLSKFTLTTEATYE